MLTEVTVIVPVEGLHCVVAVVTAFKIFGSAGTFGTINSSTVKQPLGA
jgi:hypothetical protein